MDNKNHYELLTESRSYRRNYLDEMRKSSCYERARSYTGIFIFLAQVISLFFTVPRLIQAWNLNVPDQMWRCIIEGAAICIIIFILGFIIQSIFDMADIMIDKNHR